MISHKAVTILWWVVPFRWLIWFCTIFASVIGAFEVAENILSLTMPFNNGQQIPVAFLSSGIGVIFLTNEKILNVHKNMKSIDLLSQRLSELEASMTPQDIEELERIEEQTEKIIQYGVDIDPWYEIKLGEIARLAGLNEDAMKHYHRAREQFVENGDEKGVAKALNNIGNVEKTFGNMNKSTRLFKESLAIRERIGDLAGVAASLHNLGVNKRMKGDFDEAEKLYRRSLEIELEIGNKLGIAQSYSVLAGVIQFRDREEAINLYHKSLEINREIGNPYSVVLSLANLARQAIRQNELEIGENFAKEGYAISREIGYPSGEAASLNKLGEIYRRKGDLDQAKSYLLDCLTIREQLGSVRGVAYTNISIGRVHLQNSEFDEARTRFVQSLEGLRDIGDRWGEAKAMKLLSRVAFKTDSIAEGEVYKKMADELFASLGRVYEEE